MPAGGVWPSHVPRSVNPAITWNDDTGSGVVVPRATTQCAAVSTRVASSTDPPQPSSAPIRRKICHGACSIWIGEPPTIEAVAGTAAARGAATAHRASTASSAADSRRMAQPTGSKLAVKCRNAAGSSTIR